eukprot:COSAG01_NODE_58001_length_308_cov_10.478469_1_plen_75_part_10
MTVTFLNIYMFLIMHVLAKIHVQPYSCMGQLAGPRARAAMHFSRPAGPYPQYVDDGQLALEVALVMRSARCFLQR